MKRIISIALAAVLCISLFTACSGGNGGQNTENKTLNLYTWEGMFPEDVMKAFESETGIKINYINFDYDETMLSKLQTAKGGDYDLIIADDYIIKTAIDEGLVSKLDKEKISNFSNINPIYQGQFYDENDEYTVPYGAGIQTIVYNPKMVDKEIKGYADLWDESFKDNLGIIANYRVINGMALKVMGESYNTEDLGKIQQAGDMLKELSPNIRLIKDENLPDDLLSEEIGAAVLYTSQMVEAKLANPELVSLFPEEGLGFGIMAQFIPVNAPNKDAAYKFIDYILQPEVAAKCFEYINYYCTTLAAEEYISEDVKELLTIPEGLDLSSMEMIETISPEANELHNKIWTEFRG